MRAFFIFVIISAVFGQLSAAKVDIRPVELRNYKVNEPVTFKITATEDDNKTLLKDGKFTVSFRYCGGKEVFPKLTVDVSEKNPSFHTVKLDKPGFILAVPSAYKTADGKEIRWQKQYFSCGCAAVEPEKIQQAGTVPADFDKFWQDGLEEYKNAKITVVPYDGKYKRTGYDIFRLTVFFPDGSGLIDGFLSVPQAKGKYPAVVGVPGAGPGVIVPHPNIRSSKKAIELFMNVHPYKTGKTFNEMQKLYKEMNQKLSTKSYFREFAWDRDKYVYRKVWLALSRAVDYVAKLPEFDGKNFASAGFSQGGGTALAIGALNKNITCVVSACPAFCDQSGYLLDRQSGWPMLHSALKGKADSVIPYFDCASFAARLKVPTIISVGYIDTTCASSTVYAAYNNIQAPKQIVPMFTKGHNIAPESRKILVDFMDKHLNNNKE